jgi:hypothetical protein
MYRKDYKIIGLKTVAISRAICNFAVKMCREMHTDSGPYESPFLIKETLELVRLAQGLSVCEEISASVHYSHTSFIGSLF